MSILTFVFLALPALLLMEQVSAADYVRGCYFTNWAQYRPGKGKYEPEDYEPGLCTHMLFAFGWMKEDFTVKAYDPADLPVSWKPEGGMYERVNRLKQKDPGLKTLLSIGGWTFGTRLFDAMSASAAGRKTFIDSAIAFVIQHGFDGLDIDWEYPKGKKAQYITFIAETRAAFDSHPSKLMLTCAVGAAPGVVDEAYDVAKMAPLFDFVMLMSYDFHGAWDKNTGLNSPLYGGANDSPAQKDWNTANSAEYWHKSGMPREKLIIGIAAYGRGWTLVDPSKNGVGAPGAGAAESTEFVREAGMSSYYELCALEAAGATKKRSEEYGVPYLYKGNQWFGYDDPQSVGEKMDWLKSKGYGGAFVWTLDFDDFHGDCGQGKYPILNAIKKGLSGGGGVSPTPSPTPTPPPASPTPTTTSAGSSPSPTPSSSSSSAGTPTPSPTPSSSSSSAGTTTPSSPTPTPSATPKPSTQKPGGAFVCPSDGFHANPASCHSFYRCVGGTAHFFGCPGDLMFNPEHNYCDWPANVSC